MTAELVRAVSVVMALVRQDMLVLMLMLHGMGMGGAVMGMGDGVLMEVAVLPRQGVQHHDHGPRDHDGKSHEIRPRGPFVKEEKGQGGTDEGATA